MVLRLVVAALRCCLLLGRVGSILVTRGNGCEGAVVSPTGLVAGGMSADGWMCMVI